MLAITIASPGPPTWAPIKLKEVEPIHGVTASQVAMRQALGDQGQVRALTARIEAKAAPAHI